jgi:hypothetical protein
MNLSTQPFEAFHPSLHHHDGEVCPMCEQVIPNDRLEQVKARQAQHQRELESQLALKLKAERDRLTAQLRQQHEEALTKARQEAGAKETAARAEERRLATAEAEVKVLAAKSATEAARVQAEELKKRLEASAAAAAEQVTAARAEERRSATAEADAKVVAANTATETARAEAGALQKQLEAKDAATTEKVNAARVEARRTAAAEADVKIAAANAARDAERAQAVELKKQLEASNAEVAAKVTAAQDAARQAAEAALQPHLAAAQAATQQAQEQARVLSEREQVAVAAKTVAEQQAQALRDAHEKAFREGIQETRDALDKSHRDAINAEQAKHFEDKQKFQTKVDELQRQLENKTALELGEGAEVDLFEALKEAFPGDEIARIPRGVAGADIRQMVRHNSKDCGLILYDSKNHRAWRNDFVTKLRDDQIAGKADHAILSTIAFPQGTRQLHIQDGVVLVNPARVVAIAELVRRQILQAHCLNLSNDDREQKSLELYSFIMSERFGALMTKLHATTDSLNELEAKEQAAHRVVWQKRGQLIGSVAKAEADLRSEIDRIVGTADTATDDQMSSLLADTARTGA